MSDLLIRREGKAGRITLNRPKALNALNYAMVLDIEKALDEWANDDSMALVIVDAAGEKAFCAGGDIVEMYETAKAGNFEYGRKFWHDEYRLNAKIANFPKPYIAFMQGFTMGGGVGIACHGSHRIVGDSTRISMPECAIGLVPDVGGSLLLARAPGHLGEYLGTTGTRMDAGDAIHAGFADYFIAETIWPELIEKLTLTGNTDCIADTTLPAPASKLDQAAINTCFDQKNIASILNALTDDDWGKTTEKLLRRNCPLSVTCTLEIIGRVRREDTIEHALDQEYRFTSRSASQGDFVEGIRAAIIDKDRKPVWSHARLEDITETDIIEMLRPISTDTGRV